MKHIKNLLFLSALWVSALTAQQKNSITVTGETYKTIEIEKYIVNIEFREVVGDNYRNVDAKTVPELKKGFASMLSLVNINFALFEEDAMYRINSHEYPTSSYYYYTTTSLKEVQQIISQKMTGVVNSRVDIIAKEMSNEQIAELSKKAIDDAQERAQKIASKVGRNTGEIIAIENINYKYQNFYSSRVKEPLKYYIKVTFLLE